MAEITQIISTVTTLPSPPNPNVPSTFDDLAYPYTVAQNAFGLDVNDMATELNTFATQTNAVRDEVNTARDDAVTAKEAAELARDEAVGAVATLPDGIINDGTVSTTDTWSSNKIDNTKLAKTIDNFLEQLTITAFNYVAADLTSVIYEGGYKVVYSYTNGNLHQEKFYDVDQTTLLLTKTYSYVNGNLTSITRN